MKMLERLKLAILMLIHDERAGISLGDVVLMAVSFLLVAVLGPIAIGTVVNTSTTNWNSAVKTIFQVLLPILWIIGVAVAYIPRRGK
jgi:2C-methyl-D-erythritol 2,4-cyclodiphosphate synthase